MPDHRAAARLLESLLVLSGGLSRIFSRRKILNSYELVYRFQRNYRDIDSRLLGGGGDISITNYDEMAAILRRYSPSELVIASAHHGHFIAFLCACARQGIPLAGCYQSASQGYLDAAAASGISHIDVDRMPSPRHLLAALDSACAEGRYVSLMLDAPFESRRRHDFLGYSVSTSWLPSLYARHRGALLLPLVSSISPGGTISATVGPIMEKIEGDTTQELLTFLQSVIIRECHQYQWQSNSIILSDAQARAKALEFLDDALAWRDRQ